MDRTFTALLKRVVRFETLSPRILPGKPGELIQMRDGVTEGQNRPALGDAQRFHTDGQGLSTVGAINAIAQNVAEKWVPVSVKIMLQQYERSRGRSTPVRCP
jgi:hypothetical protein